MEKKVKELLDLITEVESLYREEDKTIPLCQWCRVLKKYEEVVNTIRYTPDNAQYIPDTKGKCKSKVTIISESREVLSQERSDLIKFGELYGLPKNSYGKVVTTGGKYSRIVGLLPSRRKFQVVIDCGTKKILTTVDSVKRQLEKGGTQ